MKYLIYWILIVLGLSTTFANSQKLQIAPFEPISSLKNPIYKNADEFRLMRPDGFEVSGVAVGPRNGQPVLLVSGFFGSAYYFTNIAENLVQSGHRVYLLSLRGKGSSHFKNSISNPSNNENFSFGFDEMIGDISALAKEISKKHKRPISFIGHSLAGLVGRAVITGFTNETGNVEYNKESRNEIRQHIKQAIILKSPSPVFTRLNDYKITMSLQEKWRKITAAILITKFMPLQSGIQNSKTGKLTSDLFHSLPFSKQILNAWVGGANLILPGVLNTTDITDLTSREVLSEMTAEKIAPDIVRDIERFMKSDWQSKDTEQNYSKKYFELGPNLPTLLVSATSDPLAPMRLLREEAKILSLEHTTLGTTHMDGLIGPKVNALSQLIHNFLNEGSINRSCKSNFKSS